MRMPIKAGIAAVILALSTAVAAVVLSTAAGAATGCSVTYAKSWDNGSGFGANLTIKNLGDPWTSWTLRFAFPGSQRVTQGWGGLWSQPAGSNQVTAVNESWNGAIPTGGTVNGPPGFNGSYTGANVDPTSFSVNNVTCTGAVVTTPPPTTGGNRAPTVSLTSPANGASFAAPATINLAANASDPDGTVARVEFLNGSTVLNSDTTSPYSFSWTNVPAGTYTLAARAVDNQGASTTSTTATVTVGTVNGPAPALHVSGNRILTASGATYRLLGANRSGGEFACIQGNGMWDGPMDQASINAIRTWKVRAIRVPLNEECWLGTSSVPANGTKGAAYITAVTNYVNLLISSGITPILELHWSFGVYTGTGHGSCPDINSPVAACQKPMPDAQLSPQFWTSVANTFKGNNAVVFDLFNEPYPDFAANFNTQAGWTCWRDGGTCTGIPYQVAGFQSLVNAVRATGATNVIMIGGLAFSNDLSQWLQFKPTDSTGNLVAFGHIYNFNSCSSTSCFDSQMAPVAAQVPLTLSEIGENDCAHGFIDTVMSWADAHAVGYLGWTWNTWPCNSGPALITDYNGTATPFGQGLKDHLNTVSN